MSDPPSFASFNPVPSFSSFQAPGGDHASQKGKARDRDEDAGGRERHIKSERDPSSRTRRRETERSERSGEHHKLTKRHRDDHHSEHRTRSELQERERHRSHRSVHKDNSDDSRVGESSRSHRPSKHARSRSPSISSHGDSRRERDRSSIASASTASAVIAPTVRFGSSEQPTYDRDLFYTDTRGDEHAARYGVDYYKIPRYYRFGAGRVVGLDQGLRITRQSNRSRSAKGLEVTAGGERRHRYIDSAYSWRTHEPAKRRIATRHRPFVESDPTGVDFIRLGSRGTYLQEDASMNQQPYRDIYGPAKNRDLDDGSDQTASDEGSSDGSDEDVGEKPTAPMHRKLVALDRRVRQDPCDIRGWLDLVALQGEPAGVGGLAGLNEEDPPRKRRRNKEAARQEASARASRAALRRSAAEIQLSTLSRALSATPDNARSIRLLLAQLTLAAHSGLWDSTRLETEWTRVLAANPGSPQLWHEYARWRQNDWSGFQVTKMVDVYADGLDALSRREQTSRWDDPECPSLEKTLVDLFSQSCSMLRQAGHAERAIGAFQAQLELNFCRPRHLNSPPEAANDGSLRDAAVDAKRQWTKQVLDELEEFWDGEASRVGETGGHGWDCQDREGEATVPTTVQSRELKSMSDVGKPESTDQHPVARWLSLERSSAQKRCMPTRTTDEPDWEAGETEIDPYATVLFSDIRPLLFILHTEQGKQHLVASLLEYMGVPTGSSPESAMGITALGRLADSVALQNCFWPSSLKTENGQEGSIEPPTWDVINGEVMERERDSGLADPFKCPLKAFPASPDTLVAPALPQSSGSWFTLVDRKDVASSDVSLISPFMDHLQTRQLGPSLRLLHLALEAAKSHKNASKLARRLLGEHRQDLALWDGYARLERSAGKIDAARNVYATALSMCTSFSPQEREYTPALWSSWAELEWEEGSTQAALAVLIAAANAGLGGAGPEQDLQSLAKNDTTQVSSLDLLTARRFFARSKAALADDDARAGWQRYGRDIISCHALLEYLSPSTGQGFDAACRVFEAHLAQLGAVGPANTDESASQTSTSTATQEAELIWMAYTKLVYRHVTTQKPAAYRPSVIRDILTRAVTLFPSNTAFLSLLAANEMRPKLENHVRLTLERSVLGRANKNGASLLEGLDEARTAEKGWLFAIYVELNMYTDRFNEYAVRSLFDRAVEDTRTTSSSTIWRLYIDFEVRLAQMTQAETVSSRKRGQNSLNRAKQLVYRAIRECPWCKELYLVAFEHPLRTVFRTRELRDLYNLMGDKDLRVHTDLLPFLEDWDSEQSEDDGRADSDEELRTVLGSDAATAAAATSARQQELKDMEDRKRLMPY